MPDSLAREVGLFIVARKKCCKVYSVSIVAMPLIEVLQAVSAYHNSRWLEPLSTMDQFGFHYDDKFSEVLEKSPLGGVGKIPHFRSDSLGIERHKCTADKSYIHWA